MVEPDYIRAHKYSSKHRESVLASEQCGCFCCLRIFQPSEIKFWTHNKSTALCPYCGIDSIIGTNSGFPVTREFLQAMKAYWF